MGKLLVLPAILFLCGLTGPTISAQTWTEKRAPITGSCSVAPCPFPPPTPITGQYAPANAVPFPIFSQQPFIWDSQDKLAVSWLQDYSCEGQCEWGNAWFGYAESADNRVATTGASTGWSLLDDSLNTQLNGNGAVTPAECTTTLGCTIAGSGTIVTITLPRPSARFVPAACPSDPVANGCYFQTKLTDPTFNTAEAGSPVTCTTYGAGTAAEPLCTVFTYSVAGVDMASTTCLSSAQACIIGPSESATQMYRRHTEGCVYDTARNAIWCLTGIGDVESEPCIVSGTACTGKGIITNHTGIYDLYEFTETSSPGSPPQWAGQAICGFTTSIYCQSPDTSQTVSTATGNGIPCSTAATAQCGYKFPFSFYDPTNDVIGIFGGQFNSSLTKEVLLYYPGTVAGHHDACSPRPCWYNVPVSGAWPETRWAQGDSRMPAIGGGNVFLFGGSHASLTGTLNDTWIFNTTTLSWTQPIACSTPFNACAGSPPANLNPIMDYDADLGAVIHLDNTTNCGGGTCTWFYYPSTGWAKQAYTNGPNLYQCVPSGCTLVLYNASGVYDPVDGVFEVFFKVSGSSAAGVYTLSLP